MATNTHLTPELEQFARACVTSGRYNNVSEVVRAGALIGAHPLVGRERGETAEEFRIYATPIN